MSELVVAAAQDEFLIPPRGRAPLHGIDFDEDFLSELIDGHFRRHQLQAKPMFSNAYGIYMPENPSAHRRKFKTVPHQAYALFVVHFGDMPLDELRHVHITEFRDRQLACGRTPQREAAHQHSQCHDEHGVHAPGHGSPQPFQSLVHSFEGELSGTLAPITVEHLRKVKAHLLNPTNPSQLADAVIRIRDC